MTSTHGARRSAVLLPYPGTGCAAVQGITVDACRTDYGGLSLQYRLTGQLQDLHIPAPQPASFRDGLWQHTCFEAFVAVKGRPAYGEFNFSPSGEWAAYRFSEYRQLAASAPHARPQITLRSEPQCLQLSAVVDVQCLLPPPAADAIMQLGLTAVIESRDGSRSYWALAHPAARPDFHDRGGFILTLPLAR